MLVSGFTAYDLLAVLFARKLKLKVILLNGKLIPL